MKKLYFVLAIVSILFSSQAKGDGFIIPWLPEPVRPMPPVLSIKYHHVDIKIENQYAETSIDQVFKNHFHRDLEGTFIFPIPFGASISKFSMWVGEEELKGEVLDKDEAKKIYEDIVRRKKDPALLEWFGDGMFRARVYPIPANGETKVTLEYSEVLESFSGLCEYHYTLATEKFSRDPLKTVKLSVDLNSDLPIKNIYSPTHNIKVDKIDEHKAKITYFEENTRPNKDFILYYTVSKKDFGFNLLTYKDEKEGGFFLGMVSPKVKIPKGKEIKKIVLFILDTSGSMSGKKIKQAKKALEFCLNNLNKNDRFNIIDFDDRIKTFKDELVFATQDNVDEGISFVENLTAEGGTNINDALLTGLEQVKDEKRLTFIIFLTDGLPTVGNTDIKSILKNVKGKNTNLAKIFVFGVGYDVNTHLLDRLSDENSGTSDYVSPDEDIEVKVSNFYKKISNPVLANIELEFDGINTSQIYPRRLPDIFEGTQLVVVGKFEGEGEKDVILSGTVDDVQKDYIYKVDFKKEKKKSFIPKLWAKSRVGYLIDQIRLYGKSEELVDEIVKLSKKYGIINEYTSFLVRADYRLAHEELTKLGESIILKKTREDVGRGAVYQAKSLRALQAPTSIPQDQYFDSEGRVIKVTDVAFLDNKTFYNKDGLWVDSEYDGKIKTIKILKFSPAYFKILNTFPEIGKFMSLGDDVIFVLKDLAFQVGDEGETDLSDDDLERLFE